MKNFLTILLCVLLLGSLASDIGYIWIKKNKDNHPTIVSTTISTLKDTDVKTYVFDLNYFANQNNFGAEMFEIKITCYTGVDRTNIYSYGIQVVNPSAMAFERELHHYKTNFLYNENYFRAKLDMSGCQVTYFNSDDKFSYNATTALNENDNPYVIDVDGELVAFKFDKVTEIDRENAIFWAYINNMESDFNYFLYKMYTSMSTLTEGEGVYDNLLVGLNDVFSIYNYNKTTGHFDILSTMGYTAEYMGVRIKYHERGATINEDSMFNKLGSAQKGGVIYG